MQFVSVSQDGPCGIAILEGDGASLNHRRVITPGHFEAGVWVDTDVTSEAQEVQEVAAALWTPEVRADWLALQQSQLPSSPDLKAVAADKRWRVETGGITVNGVAIPTDRASQAMIAGAVAYVQLNSGASIDFKAAGGFVTLTAAQMVAIGQAVGAHVQACFAAEKAMAADVSAGAITSVGQIESDPRWP